MERTFQRNIQALGEVFDFVRDFVSREKIDQKHQHLVSFVVEELFTNMVRYNKETTNEIVVGLEKRDDVLKIFLMDFEVEPFDVTKVKPAETDKPLAERRVGGLGLHLVKHMVDKIDYSYSDGWSKITLTKRIKEAYA